MSWPRWPPLVEGPRLVDLDALRASADVDESNVSGRVLDDVLARLASLASRFEQMEERMAQIEQKMTAMASNESEGSNP